MTSANTIPSQPILNRQQRRVLEALQRGPKTNAFLAVTICLRFGARIHELRQAGYRIEIIDRDTQTGLITYCLDPECCENCDKPTDRLHRAVSGNLELWVCRRCDK